MPDKEVSTFDNLKALEEKKHKARLSKLLTQLKEKAKEVQEMKEECNVILSEVCEDEKEQKRILDWINNLPDVQITEERKVELRKKMKSEVVKEEKKIEDYFEQHPEKYQWMTANPLCINNSTYGTSCGGTTYTTSGTLNLCSSATGVSVS